MLTPAPNLTTTSKTDSGGHWYRVHKSGKVTALHSEGGSYGLRQARLDSKKGWCVLPSVTTYFKALHKGPLERWKFEQVARAATTTDLEPTDDWLERVIFNAFKQVGEAASLGTDIHKAIEDHYVANEYQNEFKIYVEAVEKAREEAGITFIHHEKLLADPGIGYAGTCDIIGTDMDGNPVIADFKTRKTTPGRSPNSYETDKMQIAAYGMSHFGDDFSTRGRGMNFIISTSEPGRVVVKEHKLADLNRFYMAFKSLVEHWQWIKNYQPNTTHKPLT